MGRMDYLKRDDWNASCDVCGLKYKASMLKKRWDGLMVCDQDYELRNPQDFLRVPREDIAPPWARPWLNQFVTFRILAENGNSLITEDDEYITTEYG